MDYDHKGFFVITTDLGKKQINVKHDDKDKNPRFIIQGHFAEAILLSLLKNELVSYLSYTDYLGSAIRIA